MFSKKQYKVQIHHCSPSQNKKNYIQETLARPAVWHTKMLIKIQNEI